MRRLLIIAIVAALAWGCSDEKNAPHPAALAALDYYNELNAGNYSKYVDGMSGTDSIPQQYREQLETSAKQFMHAQRDEHRAIDSFRIVGACDDSLARYTNVFLEICYADSLREEIVVAMVEQQGRWLMK